jgi:hypothetical protein
LEPEAGKIRPADDWRPAAAATRLINPTPQQPVLQLAGQEVWSALCRWQRNFYP